MLILAGVSINAIIGENGLLTKSQYATFLSEMAAVEEAVGMWKVGEAIEAGGQTTAIPTNGLCKANDVTSAERLTGEVGYYRVWSMSGMQPVMNILSSASEFNSAYDGELVTYPAGVQDLYYLNNETCGIDSKKTYLIDAATGMVYSMSGISLKGVSCYSSNMAKAVMNGDTTTPNFAEAEVSGSGSGEKLAGNVQSEFLEDGKTPNPEYNPNGFQIIADRNNNNLYKLYNNGDLYAKGIKGTLLNTSEEEMKDIDSTIWQQFNIPKEIPGADMGLCQLFHGYGTVYVVDSNKDLWAWGNNSHNKLGLSQEEQMEFTGKVPVKLNLYNQKVYKIFPSEGSTYVITMPDENNKYQLYVSGYNLHGELGVDDLSASTSKFLEVEFSNPENIVAVAPSDSQYSHYTLVLTNDEEDSKLYFAGSTNSRSEAVDDFF